MLFRGAFGVALTLAVSGQAETDETVLLQTRVQQRVVNDADSDTVDKALSDKSPPPPPPPRPVCHCASGNAAVGGQCSHSGHICASCFPGFRLNGVRCVPIPPPPPPAPAPNVVPAPPPPPPTGCTDSNTALFEFSADKSQWRCANGICVAATERCDGTAMCGDGSDEKDCGPKEPVEGDSAECPMTTKGMYPAHLMCHSGVVATTKQASRTPAKYDEVVKSVQDLIKSIDTSCTNTACPQGEFSACILRMAGHDFMDFNKATGFGGSDGCVDFKDPDNIGLRPCLVDGESNRHLNEAYVQHRREVSLADFFVIAGEAAMAFERHDNGELQKRFRDQFKWGRTTREKCGKAEGQIHLPLPSESCEANKKTFIDNIGLTWRGVAALTGVHSLGRARKANSGFDGWWSDAISASIFNNNYYISMAAKGWVPDRATGKPQWIRSGQRSNPAQSTEMMLNTDMCLLYENMQKPKANLRAEDFGDRECCAWIMPIVNVTNAAGQVVEKDARSIIDSKSNREQNTWCGFGESSSSKSSFFAVKHWCCSMGQVTTKAVNHQVVDCNAPKKPAGPAALDVLEFATDESVWLDEFLKAWGIATTAHM